MDFPLPIRSVASTVDYFTPLSVDTNIEYCMDMEKFPEINNTSHYCEPALIVVTNSYLPSDLCDMELMSFSEDGDVSLDVSHGDFQDLLATLDSTDFHLDDLISQDFTTCISSQGFPVDNLPYSQHRLENSQSQSPHSTGESGNQESLNKAMRKRSDLDLSEDIPSLRRPKLDLNNLTHVSFESPSVQTLSREC